MNKKDKEPYCSIVAKLRPKREMDKKVRDLKVYYKKEKRVNFVSVSDVLTLLINKDWEEKFDAS